VNTPPPGLLATPRAFASVRRMTLADGAEAGLDAIALSTGGGLDAWLLAGRCLDIGPLWWRGRQLAWMPPQGLPHAAFRRGEEEGGHGFARMFGGALVTCGLSHIRQPAGGEPLHGRLPFTPARVTLCRDANGLLEVEGEVVEARLGGPVLVLRRRMAAQAGGATLRIEDEVENAGHAAAPHAILHHMNFGWPLLAPGTQVELDGTSLAMLTPGDAGATPIVACHAARGEARITAPDGLSLTLRFNHPFFQLWHDLRPGICVVGLEPCSTMRGDTAPLLEPGERRRYAMELAFAG
jgi:hypothetical protein